jgi:hypothetical protein
MGIHNTNTVLARSNFVNALLYEGGLDADDEIAGATGTKLDLTAWRALAGDAKKLVATLDDFLFGGGMPPGVRSAIYDAVEAIDPANVRERARTAIYLAATSLHYQVSR